MNKASDDAEPRSRWERWRKPAAWTSFALAVIVTLASTLTVWVKRQALDTDAWTKTSTELLQNAQVRQALSVYMVDQLYQNVDVTKALEQRLPPALDPLAAPAAAGLRQVGVNLADDILSTSAFQSVWAEANRRAHQALISLLEGNKSGPVALVNGAVVLDLRPLVDRLRARMGVAANLPPDTGLITIIKSDQVTFAQNAVKVIKALTVFLFLIALALFALALWLARGWRRTMLAACGAGLLGVGLVVLVVRRIAGNALVNALTDNQAARPPANTAWLLATSLLRDLGIALLVYGALIVVAAWLAGPSRPAVWVRRRLAPAFRGHPVAVFSGVGVVLLIVLAWAPLGSGRRLFGMLLLAALIFAGVELLRRQTLREFPEGGGGGPPPAGA